jgi:hypothetical protein
MHEEFRLIFDL